MKKIAYELKKIAKILDVDTLVKFPANLQAQLKYDIELELGEDIYNLKITDKKECDESGSWNIDFQFEIDTDNDTAYDLNRWFKSEINQNVYYGPGQPISKLTFFADKFLPKKNRWLIKGVKSGGYDI